MDLIRMGNSDISVDQLHNDDDSGYTLLNRILYV